MWKGRRRLAELPARLAEPERRKLVGLCGRFGSDSDQERATAAAIADKFVKARGGWDKVICPPANDTDAASAFHASDDEDCVANYPGIIAGQMLLMGIWSAWERSFLEDMSRRGSCADRINWRPLSDKQAVILRRLWRRWKQMQEAQHAGI